MFVPCMFHTEIQNGVINGRAGDPAGAPGFYIVYRTERIVHLNCQK